MHAKHFTTGLGQIGADVAWPDLKKITGTRIALSPRAEDVPTRTVIALLYFGTYVAKLVYTRNYVRRRLVQ